MDARTLAHLVAASITLAACSNGPVRFVAQPPGADASVDATADAVTEDLPARTCTPGRWYCEGRQRAYQCNAVGVEVASQRCEGDARCLGGAHPCGVCVPSTVRCNPGSPDAPQHCAADGQSWVDHLSCDSASNEHCTDGVCQRVCPADPGNENSYLGCEYWATPTPNSPLNYSFQYALVLANSSARDAHVTITGGRLGSIIERTVVAGSVERVNLPWIDVLKGSSAACFPLPFGDCQAHSAYGRTAQRAGSYRVLSDVPLAAYQFNPLEYRTGAGAGTTFSYTADASMLLPQNVLGDPRNQEYIVVTRPNWVPMRSTTGVPYGAFVSIVSGGPNTVGPDGASPIEVTVDTRATVGDPSNFLRTLPPGRHTFTLQRGDVLQLVGTRGGEDLTGSTIRANGPIAVFVGHDCVNVPEDTAACDHLEEQLLPSATWGRRYAVTFLRERSNVPNERSLVRIMSQADNNPLTFDGISTPAACNRSLARGQFCEFETSENFVVSGERPILVTQFMVGLGESPLCRPLPGQPPPDRDECVGDPAMAFEVPIEQFRNRYDVLIPDTYRLNFVNATTPVGAELTLDGQPLDPATVRGPYPVGANLEVRVIRMAGGTHTLATVDGRPFGAKVYGVAAYTSYMYSGGLNLAPINPPG